MAYDLPSGSAADADDVFLDPDASGARAQGPGGRSRPFAPPPPEPPAYPPTEARRPGDDPLAAFELQKRVAAGAKHWAPIHLAGRVEEGTFAVLDQYARSVQWLLKLRVRLDAEAIYHLARSIVDGLKELDAAASRGHGGLNASNVFLAEAHGPVSRSRVLLSDLEPAAPAGQAGDVRALGHLLYHCVTHERYTTADLHVRDTDDWRRLGKQGEGWRRLCADLVTPVAAQTPTLAQVEQRLAGLRVKRNRWVRPLAYAAVLAVVGLTVAYAAWNRREHALWSRYSEAYRERWFVEMRGVLCAEPGKGTTYINDAGGQPVAWRAWFDPRSGRPDSLGDPTWNEILSTWTPGTAVRDPKDISYPTPGSAAEIRGNAERVEALRAKIAAWPAIAEANRAADVLDRYGHPELAKRYRDLAARVAASVAGPPANGGGGESLPMTIAFLAKLRHDTREPLAELLRAADDVRNLQAAAAGSGDPVLDAFEQRVASAVRPDGTPQGNRPPADELKDLTQSLNDCVGHGRKYVRRLADKRLKGDRTPAPAPANGTRKFGEQLDARALAAGSVPPEVATPVTRPDEPLVPLVVLPDFAARVQQVDKELSDLANKLKDRVVATHGKTEDVAARARDLNVRVVELRALREAADGLKARAATRPARKPDADALARQAAELFDRLTRFDLSKERAAVEAVVAAAERKAVESHGAAELVAQRNKEIEGRRAAFADTALAPIWARCFPELESRAKPIVDPRALRVFFDLAADRLRKSGPFDAPAAPPATDNPDAARYEAPLLAAVAAEWESARPGWQSKIVATDLLDATDRLANELAARRDAHKAKQAAAVALARTAGELYRRLSDLERLDAPPAGARPLAELAAAVAARPPAWKADPGLTELDAVAGGVLAVDPVLAKLSARPPAFAAADRASLAAWATSGSSPALRRNAWVGLKRMSESPPPGVSPWPATAEELDAARKACQGLREAFAARSAALGAAGRPADAEAFAAVRQKAEGELAAAGLDTLRRFVDHAGSADPTEALPALELALRRAVREDFDVASEAALLDAINPRVRIAQELGLARADVPQPMTEKDVAAKVETLVKRLTDLAAQFAARGGRPDVPRDNRAANLQAAEVVKGLVADLRKATGGGAPVAAGPPDFKAIGPGAIGWTPQLLPGGESVRYAYAMPPGKGGTVTMDFAKVPGLDVYLCTTELSIAMANAIVASAEARSPGTKPLWGRVQALAASPVEFGPDKSSRRGARAWLFSENSGQLEKAPNWLNAPGSWVHYSGSTVRNASNLPAGQWGGDPTPNHPLHRISAVTAVYLSALAHARPPTVAEWQAAYNAEAAPAGGATTVKWNRRDAAYEAQEKYVTAQRAAGETGTKYPNFGAFWPKGVPSAVTNPLEDNPGASLGVPADGVLWFCPVDSDGRINPDGTVAASGGAPGQRFKHLIGNVAEFVTTEPVPAVPNAEPAKLADAVQQWVVARGGEPNRIRVIGASALSPATYPTADGGRADAKPEVAFEANNTGTGRREYSDVGLRLAVAANPGAAKTTADPLIERFRKWLDGAKP